MLMIQRELTIAHKNIKPSNMLMIEDGQFIKVGRKWKISDFGNDRFYVKEKLWIHEHRNEVKKARIRDLFTDDIVSLGYIILYFKLIILFRLSFLYAATLEDVEELK